jgi:PilZ domain
MIPRRIDLTVPYPVLLKSAIHSGRGQLVNISSNGGYVATPMPLLPQAQVSMLIILPELKHSVRAEAVVTWENRGEAPKGGLPPGYGIRFIKLPEETALKIRELLETATDPTPTMPLGQKYSDFFQLEDEPEGPPFPLRADSIARNAPDSPGIFVLSYDRAQEAWVGRADGSIRATLGRFVGEYAYFYCEPILDPTKRFHAECKMFHHMGGDRGQLDNLEHPFPPPHTGIECPVCVASKRPTRQGV